MRDVERINGSLAMFLTAETLEGLISKDGPGQ